MTATAVTTYQYDAANRLLQSDIQGGDTTIYDWDNASRLITTTVASTVSRVYGYSQDGDLLSALVDGQTTTFLYDGNGNRLQMTVDSEVTTYTLDYGRGFQLLMEQGGAFATVKHYLYGLECIGELVDADIPASKEWRYYQRDGNSLVRQTTNEQADITLAWTFSPEGAVVLGEEGPVTNLDCGSNATYDWSTGLIFKGGRYFDPRTGIWLTLGGIIVWQAQQQGRKKYRRMSKQKRRLLLILLFLLLALTLVGCGAGRETATPCPDGPNIPSSSPSVRETLTIHPILVEGSTATPGRIATQQNYANQVLKPAGIQINLGQSVNFNDLGEPSSAPSLSQDVLGNNMILDVNSEQSVPSSEEVELIKYYQNNSGYDITAYFVQGIRLGGIDIYGKHYKSGYTNTNSVVISDIADTRTLVHEVGHVLGLDHPNDETGWPHDANGVSPQIHGIQGDNNQATRKLIERNFMTQSLGKNMPDDYISELQIATMIRNIPLDTFGSP